MTTGEMTQSFPQRFLADNSTATGDENDDVRYMTSDSLQYSISLNAFLFVVMWIVFELNRNSKRTFMCRYKKHMRKMNRVPKLPPTYFGGWLVTLWNTREDDVLEMVGLDAYMFLRFIVLCIKSSTFLLLLGLSLLLPFFAAGRDGLEGWNGYTIGNMNVDDDEDMRRLWVVVAFMYVFTLYFCNLFSEEYRNFVDKRVKYLQWGDADTPTKANYTVMLEGLPMGLRSRAALKAFMDDVFPGKVTDVEVPLDLNDLEALISRRTSIVEKLEKAVAMREASGGVPEYISVDSDETLVLAAELTRLREVRIDREKGGSSPGPAAVIDAVQNTVTAVMSVGERLTSALQRSQAFMLNKRGSEGSVGDRSTEPSGRKSATVLSGTKSPLVKNATSSSEYGSNHLAGAEDGQGHASDGIKTGANGGAGSSSGIWCCQERVEVEAVQYYTSLLEVLNEGVTELQQLYVEQLNCSEEFIQSLEANASVVETTDDDSRETKPKPRDNEQGTERSTHSTQGTDGNFIGKVGHVLDSVTNTAAERGMQIGGLATKAFFRSIEKASHVVGDLTAGNLFMGTSTAFVTFNSRVTRTSALHVPLSTVFHDIKVMPAPSPADILWRNVSTPKHVVENRSTLAFGVYAIGALGWSVVVTVVAGFSNIDSSSEGWGWIKPYEDTTAFSLLNAYLAAGILLGLLAGLPYFFDTIGRYYCFLKTESSVQDDILKYFFVYQVANVYVTIATSSILVALQDIIDHPNNLLVIIGRTLPSVSIYFCSLIVVKVGTALPLEMLRIWPWFWTTFLTMCLDKKKCTRRELRAYFAAPEFQPGMEYPNILMVLLISLAYASVVPFVQIFALLFFLAAYLMFKYQFLYVYVTPWQAGGSLWHTVFDRCMVCMLMSCFSLLGYLFILENPSLSDGDTEANPTFSGPLSATIPLPIIITLFWRHCNSKYKALTHSLSMEFAQRIDQDTPDPRDNLSWTKCTYRQPALVTPWVKPELYRVEPITAPGRESVDLDMEDEADQVAEDGSGRSSCRSHPLLRLPDSDDETDDEEDAIVRRILL